MYYKHIHIYPHMYESRRYGSFGWFDLCHNHQAVLYLNVPQSNTDSKYIRVGGSTPSVHEFFRNAFFWHF